MSTDPTLEQIAAGETNGVYPRVRESVLAQSLLDLIEELQPILQCGTSQYYRMHIGRLERDLKRAMDARDAALDRLDAT